ncbi:MAG: tetratricopeptide repeat protein, partial [Planctomycetota bacterium]
DRPVQEAIAAVGEHVEYGKAASIMDVGYVFLLLFIFWFVIFGYISRRLEHEADIFAFEKVGGEPFATAIERITRASGGIKFLSTWRHYSVTKRAKAAREWDLGNRQSVSKFTGIVLVVIVLSGVLFFLLHLKRDLTRSESDVIALRAGYRESRNDIKGAEEIIRQAIDSFPKESKYHYLLGLILLKKGENDDALDAWERALSLSPDEEKYQNDVNWLRKHYGKGD